MKNNAVITYEDKEVLWTRRETCIPVSLPLCCHAVHNLFPAEKVNFVF